MEESQMMSEAKKKQMKALLHGISKAEFKLSAQEVLDFGEALSGVLREMNAKPELKQLEHKKDKPLPKPRATRKKK